MTLRAISIASLLELSALSSSAIGAPPPPTVSIAERAIATLSISGFPDFLAPEGRSVWTTNENRIDRLELGIRGPTLSVAMPEPCGAPVVAFESLWVASCEEKSVYRVDTRSGHIIATIPTGLADPDGELSIASGAASVWIPSNSEGLLSRIDPQTNQTVASIRVKPHSYAAAFGYKSVWITNSDSASVQRIDPLSNRVVATIPVGRQPRFLTVGEGAVWTLNQGDGSVTRINPSTNAAVASIAVGVTGIGGDIADGAGSIWVRGKKQLLARIDPATNQVMEIFGPVAGSGAVRVADDLVWVTSHDIKTVWVLRSPAQNDR